MGNKHPNVTSNSPDYNPQLNEWQNISSGHGAPLWRHRSTGEELEEYKYMTQSPNDLRRLRNLFEFRHNSAELVATRFFIDAPKQELCGNHHLLSMFAERIHLRLSQIHDVPYPDVLHLYSNALHGYHHLFKKIGYFPIDQTMIGITRQGKVKVWLHSDFSRDRPDKDASSFTKSQHDMVVQIIQIIDRNTNHSASSENIAKFLLEQPILTFLDAVTRLNMWSLKHFVGIPDRLNTITNLIRSGHFGKMSPSRRTESIVSNANGNSRLNHLHGLLTAQQKSHLPPGSKIITTEIEEITPIIGGGRSIITPTEVSAVPIFGHTPVGFRPLSPARIVIRAQSPIRSGHSALEIRPHSPLRGQHTQLHPLLANSNIPFASNFMHPRDATLVAPISPLVRNAESAFTHNRPTTINNEELLALQRRIQSELERVNALVNASQKNTTSNITSTSQKISSYPNTATSVLNTTATPTILPNRLSGDRQTKPNPPLNNNNNTLRTTTDLPSKVTSPINTLGTTTFQPTYKAEISSQVAATPSLNSTARQYTSASLTSSYKPAGITNIASYGQSQNYNANATASVTPKFQSTTVSPANWEKATYEDKNTERVVERSPISSTTEGPKLILDDIKYTTKADTNFSSGNNHIIRTLTGDSASAGDNKTVSRTDSNFKVQSNNASLTNQSAAPIAATTTTTSVPYNTSTTYRQYKAANTERTEGGENLHSNIPKKADTDASNFFENSTRNNHEHSSGGSYPVDSSDNVYRSSLRSATAPAENNLLTKHSFDKNTNIIRISARGTTESSQGIRVLYQG